MTSPLVVDLLRQALADRYSVGRELGSGAAATVYLAEDLKYHREVAIKLLRPELAASLTGERFLREITIAAKLQHPHILPVLDSGEAAGSYYFVMPLVEGETLRQRLARSPTLSLTETLRILSDVADALAYAHRHGIVHRDIKPDNIMLTGRHAVVTDFGVAKAVRSASADDRNLTSGIALGTPAYMSPEQATANPAVDHRTDIYALGIVGYEILTGRPPFIGPTPQDILTAHVVLTPEPIRSLRPDIPSEIADGIQKCLAKAPADRWQNANEIAECFDAFVTPTSGMAPVSRGRRYRRSRWLLGGTTVVVLAGAGALLWNRRAPLQAGNPPPRAERLLFFGNVREAALSPDGLLLAYITAGPAGQDLWVQDVRGGERLSIATSERLVGVTWISEGSELSYAEGPADNPVTRVVTRLGGSSRIVGSGRGLVSPDGKLVLIATGGDPNLLVIRREQRDTLRLHRSERGWMSGVTWSPQSDRLALSIVLGDRSETAFYTLGLDDHAELIHREPRQAYGPTWSPDGHSLYFLANAPPSGKDLIRVELNHHNPTETGVLIAAGIGALDDERRWPTGTFLSVRGDGSGIVFVMEDRWSNLARFRIDPLHQTATPDPELFTMGTALYTAPRLSPDGKRIAVFVSTTRGSSLRTVGVDGGALEELALVGTQGSLAWSPDGAALAYTAEVQDTGVRLSTKDFRSGRERRFQTPVGLDLTWGLTGLFVQRPGNNGLLHADPATPMLIRALVRDSTTTTFSPRVSPDGRWIAAMIYPPANRTPALALVALGDSIYHQITPGAYRPVGWSADSRTLYAVRNGFAPAPERIWAFPIAGGPGRVLVTLPAGFTTDDISPDARLIIASQVQSQSDAWRLRLNAAGSK